MPISSGRILARLLIAASVIAAIVILAVLLFLVTPQKLDESRDHPERPSTSETERKLANKSDGAKNGIGDAASTDADGDKPETGSASRKNQAHKTTGARSQDAATHMANAAAHANAGRYGAAIREYKAAIKLNPSSERAYIELGLVYGDARRHAEAIEAFKKAVGVKPDFAEAYYCLGIAYHHMGLDGKSKDIYRKLKLIDPDWARKLKVTLAVRVYGVAEQSRE